MFRQIWAGVFLLMISTIFLFSTFALGQVSEEDQVVEVGPVLGRAIATGDYRPRALPIFADIEVEGLTTRATELLDDVEEAVNNLKPDDPKTDRPKELGKLRTFRQEVIRVTPLLRAYTDSLRLNRSTIQVYRNTISTDAEERILSRIVDWKSQLEQARSMLDEIVKQKSVPSSNTQDIDKRILEARGEINFLDRRLQILTPRSNLPKSETFGPKMKSTK